MFSMSRQIHSEAGTEVYLKCSHVTSHCPFYQHLYLDHFSNCIIFFSHDHQPLLDALGAAVMRRGNGTFETSSF